LVLLLSLIGFAFISFFDFPMERIEHQILFYTFLTIIILDYKNRFESNADLLKLNKPGLILFYSIACVNVITSLFIGFKRYEGEKGTVQVFVAHQNQDWINLIRLVDETKNNYYETDPISIPLDWYKGVAQFSLNQFPEAKQTFLQAYAIAPYNIHILNNLASTNEKLGEHQLAVKYYSEALRISPAFEESILNLSAVYFNIGDFDKAYETIDKCPYTCQDAKYIVFLKAILRNKFNNSSDNRIKTIVGNISDGQLAHIYLNSKQKNTNFTTDIINYH
jgi:tetratricopeptide (TPR) repeat protein